MERNKKILIVSTYFDLEIIRYGAQYRIKQLISILNKKEWYISTLSPYKSSDFYYAPLKFRDKILALLTDVNPFYIIKLFRIIRNYDIIQISFPWGIISAKIVSKILNKKLKIIYDVHNIECDFVYDKLGGRNHFFVKLVALYTRMVETFACHLCGGIVAISDNIRDRLIEKYKIPEDKVITIPMIPEKKYKKEWFNKRLERSKIKVLFLGTYDLYPNKEAFDLIISEIAPRLKDKDIEFIIIGTNMPKFREDNINSLGYIDDLSIIMEMAHIAISPTLHGDGQKTKIIDYLSYGLPVIASKSSLRGFNRIEGVICINDENKTEFIENFASTILRISSNKKYLKKSYYELCNTKFNNSENYAYKLDAFYTKKIVNDTKKVYKEVVE
jgi:hypothetical protein